MMEKEGRKEEEEEEEPDNLFKFFHYRILPYMK